MAKSNYFQTTHGSFHYLEWSGQGPLAHFAHATGFCAGLYDPFLSKLSRFLNVKAMDDRGHGRTEADAEAEKLTNWDPFVEDLERFFQYLKGPVIAMGHSRGAVVSLLLSARRPDLVKALILTDPTIISIYLNVLLFFAKMTRMQGRIPIAAAAAKRRNYWPDREALMSSYKRKAPFKAWQRGFLESYLEWGFTEEQGGIRLACDPRWESACFGSCPVNIWRFIPKLKTPTLIVYGDGSDIFRPATASRFKRKVPQAELVRLSNTSHFVPMERPDETAEIIKEFLTQKGLLQG